MQKILTMLILSLDFFPNYKRKAGGIALAAAAAAVAYNNFVAPSFGLPVVPAEYVEAARVGGEAVLGVGVAAAAVRP